MSGNEEKVLVMMRTIDSTSRMAWPLIKLGSCVVDGSRLGVDFSHLQGSFSLIKTLQSPPQPSTAERSNTSFVFNDH